MLSNNPLHELKSIIKAEANNLGFCVIGFSSPDQLDIHKYQKWVENNLHGGMSYLATEDSLSTRQNPKKLYPQCKTIISLGALFSNPANDDNSTPPPTSGKIACYALGQDYHQVLAQKIDELMAIVISAANTEIDWISAIDTKPLAEKELAQKAGLGWIAKNSMLTNPTFGSSLFLCEALLNIELPEDEPFQKDLCGTCTTCIEACPTNCILPDRTIDANKCLSYLTIEHRGVIDKIFFDKINPFIFGCDICLQVCPWNKKAQSTPMMKDFLPDNQNPYFDIPSNLERISSSFHRYFEYSAIRRASKQGFLRNCMIRLSQTPTDKNIEMINSIVSALPETYLSEQKKRIDEYISKKKGS